jgi:hypothetical protein
MNRVKIFGAATILSLMVATLGFAQAVIQEPRVLRSTIPITMS